MQCVFVMLDIRFVVIRVVQFRSKQAYDNAARVIQRKGRLYRLERVNAAMML